MPNASLGCQSRELFSHCGPPERGDCLRRVLVGATSVGPYGAEGPRCALTVAVHGRVPIDRLRHKMYAYPTFHRAIEHAVRDLATPE